MQIWVKTNLKITAWYFLVIKYTSLYLDNLHGYFTYTILNLLTEWVKRNNLNPLKVIHHPMSSFVLKSYNWKQRLTEGAFPVSDTLFYLSPHVCSRVKWNKCGKTNNKKDNFRSKLKWSLLFWLPGVHSNTTMGICLFPSTCFQLPTPFKSSRCIKASFYIPENRPNFPTIKVFRTKISMKLVYHYMAIFFNF